MSNTLGMSNIDMSLDDLVRKTKNDKSRISGPSKPQFKAAKPIHEKGLQHFNAHKKRGFTAKSRPSFVRNAAAPPPPITSNKLLVSNLAITVSQDDVTELFSEFGDLTSASLHHGNVKNPILIAKLLISIFLLTFQIKLDDLWARLRLSLRHV